MWHQWWFEFEKRLDKEELSVWSSRICQLCCFGKVGNEVDACQTQGTTNRFPLHFNSTGLRVWQGVLDVAFSAEPWQPTFHWPEVYPLDTMIEQLTTSPEVLCCLSPLPGQNRDAPEQPATPIPKKPKLASDGSGGPPNLQQHRHGRIGGNFPKGVNVRVQTGGVALSINGGFAISRRKPSASLGLMSVSKVVQSGGATNANTD